LLYASSSGLLSLRSPLSVGRATAPSCSPARVSAHRLRAGDFLSGSPCRSLGYTCAFPPFWGDAGGPVPVLPCRSPGRSPQPPFRL
jgi:hypothetical protein